MRTSCAGVVVVDVATMGETVVPVLALLHWQGVAWGLTSSVGTTVAIVAAIATIATTTAIHIAAATTAVVVAATAIVVAATAATVVVAAIAAITTTIATAVFSATLLATAASILGAPWLMLGGLVRADCLAEHLKLFLDRRNVGGIQS